MPDQADILENKTTQETKDLISELVGDGKKFKTVEDLAAGKLQSDIHIKRIEDENRELREKVAKAKSVEDILEAIKANTAAETNHSASTNDEETAVLPSQSLTAEQVAKIVAEQIQGSKTAEQKKANRLKANELMLKLFGDKAKDKFEAKATSPELRDTLVMLAEVNPQDFVKLFEEKGQESLVDNQGKNVNSLNTNLNPSTLEPGTQLYYSEMRKKNPKQYYSASTQLEMHTAAMRDSAKYFGRNT